MIVIEQPGTMDNPESPRLLRGTLPYYRGRDHPAGDLSLAMYMLLQDQHPMIVLQESFTGIAAGFDCIITHDYFYEWTSKFLTRLVPWKPNTLQSVWARYNAEIMSPHPVWQVQQIQVWPDPYTQEVNMTSMGTGGRIVLSPAHQSVWATDLFRVVQIGEAIEGFLQQREREQREDLLLHVYNLIHESIL